MVQRAFCVALGLFGALLPAVAQQAHRSIIREPSRSNSVLNAPLSLSLYRSKNSGAADGSLLLHNGSVPLWLDGAQVSTGVIDPGYSFVSQWVQMGFSDLFPAAGIRFWDCAHEGNAGMAADGTLKILVPMLSTVHEINQTLHLISAISFVIAYVMLWFDPIISALIAWLVSMTSRQAGHFFFEPKGYDHVNQATHEYKEEIKVGYNLQRKVVLMAIWAASPLVLFADPTLFGLFTPWASATDFMRALSGSAPSEGRMVNTVANTAIAMNMAIRKLGSPIDFMICSVI